MLDTYHLVHKISTLLSSGFATAVLFALPVGVFAILRLKIDANGLGS
jgi:hypothetical protein